MYQPPVFGRVWPVMYPIDHHYRDFRHFIRLSETADWNDVRSRALDWPEPMSVAISAGASRFTVIPSLASRFA